MTIQILKPATNLILTHDTETTGFPDWKSPSESEHQPHIVDICAMLWTPDGELVDEIEFMIKPDGWVIPDDVAELHGITTEIAQANGIDEIEALAAYGQIHKRASLRVAHNVAFDDRIIRIGIMRFFGEAPAERYKEKPKFCTALKSKPVCQLPPTEAMKATNFKNTFKTPSLPEALKFLCDEDMEEAHRARPDTESCAKIYFALRKLGVQ